MLQKIVRYSLISTNITQVSFWSPCMVRYLQCVAQTIQEKCSFFPTMKCKMNICKLQVCIPRYCHIATQTWPFKETIRNRARQTKWPYLGIMVRGLYAYISVFFIWSSHLFLLFNWFVLLSTSTLRNIALMAVIGVKNLISLLLSMPYHGFEIQLSQLETTDTF